MDQFRACNREGLAVQLGLPSRPSFGTQFPISSRQVGISESPDQPEQVALSRPRAGSLPLFGGVKCLFLHTAFTAS